MKAFLLQFFTWWNGQTLGTRFFTWRKGERIGSDEAGNTYYRTRGGAKDKALGYQRRWVIYKGEADASMIPPGWHGWLHHRTDVAPVQETYVAREWELPHQGNLTGSAGSYRPKGSILAAEQGAASGSDYQPWKP